MTINVLVTSPMARMLPPPDDGFVASGYVSRTRPVLPMPYAMSEETISSLLCWDRFV